MERLKFDLRSMRTCYLEWIDHASVEGWTHIQEILDNSSLVRCHTTGWLIKDTADELVVSTTITADGSVTDPLTIDRRLVTSLEILPRRRRKNVVKSISVAEAKEAQGDIAVLCEK